MSWLEPANPGYALRFAVHDGTRWSPAQTIVTRSDFFVNWADFPSLEVLGGNRLAAHWLQRNGTGTYAYGVRIAQSADGGKTWGAPVIPHRDTSQTEHGFVAMWNEGGTLGAVWLDGRKFKQPGHGTPASGGHDAGNEMMLVSTTLDAKGVRGPEVRLDERTCDCCQNAAVMTSSGPIVAYRNRTTDEIRDIYVTRRVGAKWVAGAPVHNDNWKIAACPVNGPALAASGARVAIAWFTAPGDSGRVNVAFSDNAGATFSAPVRVDGGSPAGRVDVALLPDGAALVTWVERVGGATPEDYANYWYEQYGWNQYRPTSPTGGAPAEPDPPAQLDEVAGGPDPADVEPSPLPEREVYELPSPDDPSLLTADQIILRDLARPLDGWNVG